MPAAASAVAGPSSQPDRPRARPRARKLSSSAAPKRSHKRKPRPLRDDSPDEILPSTTSFGKGSKSKSHRPRRGEGDEGARRERDKVLRTQDGGDAQSRRVRRRLEELERGTISGPGLDASSIALPADSTYAGAWAGLLAGRAAEDDDADDIDFPEASALRAPTPEEPEPEPSPAPAPSAPSTPTAVPKLPLKIPHRKGAAEAARRAHAEALAAAERAARGESAETPKPAPKRKRASETGAVRRKQDPELVKLMNEKKSFEVRREEAAQHSISLSATHTYETAAAPPSRYPAMRALPPPCSVCGYFAQAKCVRCEEKVCSVACTTTHDETRCERPR